MDRWMNGCIEKIKKCLKECISRWNSEWMDG